MFENAFIEYPKIAIIDNGVSSILLNNYKIKCFEVDNNLLIAPTSIESTDINHATICAAIIIKYLETDNWIYSIKIMDDDLTSISKLVTALEWCLLNSIKVINLSLGTNFFEDQHELQIVINKLTYNGICIVCASSIYNIITYPAYFCNTISVKCLNDNITHIIDYFKSNDSIQLDRIDFIANSEHLLDTFNYSTEKCNSFATPLITAKVCNLLTRNPKLSLIEIKRNLNTNKKEINRKHLLFPPDWIHKAIIIEYGESLFSNNYYSFLKFNLLGHFSFLIFDESLFKKIYLEYKSEIDTIILLFNYNELCVNFDFVEKNILLIYNKRDCNNIAINYKINKELYNQYYIWEPDMSMYYFCEYNNNSFTANDSSIQEPVILLQINKDLDYISVIMKIYFTFIHYGYNVNIICDQKIASLFNFIFWDFRLVTQNLTKNYIQFINEYKLYDIVFLASCNVLNVNFFDKKYLINSYDDIIVIKDELINN